MKQIREQDLPRPIKQWVIKQVDEAAVEHLYEALRVNKIICRMLVARGICTYQEAKDFFRPQMEQLHDPFLMKGMQEAVERIDQAKNRKERILIFGDYDVDGTTAVAVMYNFLKAHASVDVAFYIPHRYREGYGLSKAGIDYAAAEGFSLMIVLDCGIKSAGLVTYASSLGIDIIICDHHLPDENIPTAIAILNPKQADCPYPFKELSGCGIGYKLITALTSVWKLPLPSADKDLDLVATSIAADIVPMNGENRILSYYGLLKANHSPNPAISALKEVAGVQRALHISDLVFVIAPRINAAGRMDDAIKAVKLFTTTDSATITNLAEEINRNNLERKEQDRQMTEEALSDLCGDTENAGKCSTVVYNPHWHKGVVGIVASRLIDYFYRPTIVLTKVDEETVSGSARSVVGYNLYEAIDACSSLLTNYGGHNFAAGLTFPLGNLASFQQAFEKYVRSTITEYNLTPKIFIDAEIELKDVNNSFFRLISQFEPFGPGNLRPVFLTRNVQDYQCGSHILKEEHLRVVVHQGDNVVFKGIGFGLAAMGEIVFREPFDMVYTVEENIFNGQKELQIKVLAIQPAN